jgi:hypothetical protein
VIEVRTPDVVGWAEAAELQNAMAIDYGELHA